MGPWVNELCNIPTMEYCTAKKNLIIGESYRYQMEKNPAKFKSMHCDAIYVRFNNRPHESVIKVRIMATLKNE